MDMKPRPHISIGGKTIMTIIVVILVVGCLFFGMHAAFSGLPAPEKDTGRGQETSEQSDVFGDESEADPETDADKDSEEVGETPEVPDEETETPAPEKDPEYSTEPAEKTPAPESPEESKQPEKTPDDKTEPEPSAPPAPSTVTGLSVTKIWDGMRSSMGENLTANLNLSKENLADLYGIDPSICDEFILRKSGTVVTPEEYLLVKGTETNLSIVEQACQQRQVALATEWADHGFSDAIETYQIIRSGEYLFFCISPSVSQMVGIFQGMMMSVN